jgi:hypothetical protein
LVPGGYTFSVSADDAVGNNSFASTNFTITP